MTPGDAVIVLQARMASRRLPGKALATIGGRSILARCLERLRRSGAAPLLLATTTNREDDALELEARRLKVPTFRGPAADVLLRVALAAELVGARYVVRATADNPVVDMKAPRRVLAAIRRARADHVSERGLPCGAAVEAVTTSALRRAVEQASDPFDREHVTPFIRRHGTAFIVLELDAPIGLRRPELRLTVDTAEDLTFLRRVSARLANRRDEPPLDAVIAAADALCDEAQCA